MEAHHALDDVAISAKSHRLLQALLAENPRLGSILSQACSDGEALAGVRRWAEGVLADNPAAERLYQRVQTGREALARLRWRDLAAIRLLDYADNAGLAIPDLNLRGELAVSDPVRLLLLATQRGTGGAKPDFFADMIQLFRQLTTESAPEAPSAAQVQGWMQRHPSGLDPRICTLREENRERIIDVLIDATDRGEITRPRYSFAPGMSRADKRQLMRLWWQEARFHLQMAARTPERLSAMLGGSLDPDTMEVLRAAERAGVPFFVNPYAASLLLVRSPDFAIGADLALRAYSIYSQELVDEFGHIVAWEKEDLVEPGKPNAAGWLLPTATNIHRRYPDVAILIPDTAGRACGGLCAGCQRMFDFQRGNLGFDHEALEPKESWPAKLRALMRYFEEDAQLRDILVTGGDALTSSDASLAQILDAILEMAERKRAANANRPPGQKLAELQRVRLGTRLPIYLPQRVTAELTAILTRFGERARRAGIEQLVIQTHYESPLEVTPESCEAVQRLLAAGWLVTNQLVFTAPASRRGHAARLRQCLEEIGVVPYYTFTTKGYMENHSLFAPNARAMQEAFEEKRHGEVPQSMLPALTSLSRHAKRAVERIAALREEAQLPFLATDRNVLNLPGVGKSLSFRVVGITRYGRRILSFDHDDTRRHSPVVEKMGRVLIIESKSIGEYLRQLDGMGEQMDDYESVWGYSIGVTEPRLPLFDYPAFDFGVTEAFTHLELGAA